MRCMFLVLAVFVAGCNPDPTMLMQTEQSRNASYAPVRQSQRVSVERIGVFRDEIAYGNTRGVYLITDHETGAEFIGVSGVGIAETGSHSAGKSRVSDER